MIDPTPHLERFESYERACREFRWQIPDQFNIASAISRRHKDAITCVALGDVRPGGINTYTIGGIDFLSDKFANLLARSGVRQGDAVAVIASQSAALLVAQFGILKLGAAVAPLSPSLPSSTLKRALKECDARAIVSEDASAETLFINACGERTDFWREVNRASSDFTAAETHSSSPAFIFFSGLTGIIHSHASLIGQLTAFEMFNEFSLSDGSVFWAAGDWVSPQILLGLIYPALWYGCSITCSNESELLDSITQCEVTNAFIWSAEKNLMKRIQTAPHEFGTTLNAAYGTIETGLIAASCNRWFESDVETCVRAAPGHSIEILNEQGRIGVRRDDPALFLGYLNDSEKTGSAFAGDWLVTGDEGKKNEDGDLCVSPSTKHLEDSHYNVEN